MLIQWMKIIYDDVKEFYSLYMLFFVVSVGLFNLLADAKVLKEKKLKKEWKICRFIGLVYVIGGIGLYVIFKIF